MAINRRELILETATELFVKQGYKVTSVRQIAEAVGCTEAALYYHFKEGKRALFRAVIEEQMPNFMSDLEHCQQIDSLPQLIRAYGQCMTEHCQEQQGLIQWLTTEYPNLSADEKTLLHKKKMVFHRELSDLILPFVQDENEAQELTWMIMCAWSGYRHLFTMFELGPQTDFPVDKFIDRLVHCVLGTADDYIEKTPKESELVSQA